MEMMARQEPKDQMEVLAIQELKVLKEIKEI